MKIKNMGWIVVFEGWGLLVGFFYLFIFLHLSLLVLHIPKPPHAGVASFGIPDAVDKQTPEGVVTNHLARGSNLSTCGKRRLN